MTTIPKIGAALLALALLTGLMAAIAPNPSAKGKWETLFDGKTFGGWHAYNKLGQPIAEVWKIEDNAMHLTGKNGGDLVTEKEYGDFELELEWKIAEGGNSGIMYHVHEDPEFRAPYMTGPEIQVLDNDRHPDAKQGRDGNRTAGSLYDMLPPTDKTVTKPAGEWNKARIIVSKGRGASYLNGKKIVEFPTTGPDWDKLVAASKFATWKGFNKYPTGHIALQDHGDQVWYRNIRIREM